MSSAEEIQANTLSIKYDSQNIYELSNSKVEYTSKASISTLPCLNLLHALHNTIDRRQCRHMTRK